jgi:DNA-binding CsgD family transcriptional regulator
MSHGSRASASHVSEGSQSDNSSELDPARSSPARARAIDEAGAALARELNGPLTALLLYMGEIKQHSHHIARSTGERDYLQQVVENAVQQTERVCALVKQIGRTYEGVVVEQDFKSGWDKVPKHSAETGRMPRMVAPPEFRQKPLTKREREVLNLISQGYSNKQGALRMQISPRTFESHRAEAMRKLGARNTADLVRAALLQPID